jgi:hypothetical protein
MFQWIHQLPPPQKNLPSSCVPCTNGCIITSHILPEFWSHPLPLLLLLCTPQSTSHEISRRNVCKDKEDHITAMFRLLSRGFSGIENKVHGSVGSYLAIFTASISSSLLSSATELCPGHCFCLKHVSLYLFFTWPTSQPLGPRLYINLHVPLRTQLWCHLFLKALPDFSSLG